MLILGLLLGMYFDAVVVFSTTSSLSLRLAMAILWIFWLCRLCAGIFKGGFHGTLAESMKLFSSLVKLNT